MLTGWLGISQLKFDADVWIIAWAFQQIDRNNHPPHDY
jgi:hypothetical protein